MVTKTIPKKITKAVLDYVDVLKRDKLPINEVIVFGSQIKRKPHKWSDIDVCIISPSPKFKRIDVLKYLWTKKREKDIKAMISPIGFHPKDFVNEDPLVWEIKKTGKVIYQK